MALRAIWQFTDWTDQSVNCILPENTCFTCYIIPKLWIRKTTTVKLHPTNYVINQNMLNIKGLTSKTIKHDLRDQYYFNESNICRMMYVVPLYWPIYRNSRRRVVRPFVNKQFASGYHSDLMTGWRQIEIRTKYANEVYYSPLMTTNTQRLPTRRTS